MVNAPPRQPANRPLTPADHRRFWTNPGTILLGSFLLFMGSQFIAALVIAPFALMKFDDNLLMAIFMVTNLVVVLTAIAVALIISGFKWGSIGWRLPKSWKIFLWLPLLIIGYMVVSVSFTLLAERYIPGFKLDEVQDVGFKDLKGLLDMLLAFLTLVILTPIVEETIFRGVLFKGLRTRTGFWLAAIVSSVLFGIAHGQLNVAIDVFAMGMICAYTVEKSGSILPSIVIHALKNGLAFTLLFIFKVG